MIRAISGEALLFFLPFAVFALYLVLRRRSPFKLAAWSEATAWLVIAGLVCAIGALLVTFVTSERQSGAFEPTHMENGRVIPGRFK
jgi:Mn2+/Fe2+ NRAMP family transporter